MVSFLARGSLYFGRTATDFGFCFMEIDFQAIQTEDLKSRIGELRRYL
jgi:hypothetical protein